MLAVRAGGYEPSTTCSTWFVATTAKAVDGDSYFSGG